MKEDKKKKVLELVAKVKAKYQKVCCEKCEDSGPLVISLPKYKDED